MSDHYDADRRALARCEDYYLREPERGNPDGCDVCGCALADDLHLCDECAPPSTRSPRRTPPDDVRPHPPQAP